MPQSSLYCSSSSKTIKEVGQREDAYKNNIKNNKIQNLLNLVFMSTLPNVCDEHCHHNRRKGDILSSSHAPPVIQLSHQEEMQPHTAYMQMTASPRSQGHSCYVTCTKARSD